ncbi:MAG: glycosyltransferase [Kiritimatiellae bacterium]|nr:glycosyltransferase [Kiritimatiellia bacterium]
MLIVLVVALALLLVALWNAIAWPAVGAAEPVGEERVSVLIPARNEERTIRAAVTRALEADRDGIVAEVLVYDDHSEDRTADEVAAIACRDVRVRLLAPVRLPPDWCGKPFACAQLAAAATAPWLLFLDADARLEPGAPARLVAEARRRGATLLSAWPALEMCGFAERVFMPLLNFVVFTLYPAPLSLRMPLRSLGLAHGACLLARRDEYQRTGGHAMVRGELFEDTALARAWRERGLRSLCLDGRGVVRVRMYESARAMWSGFQKILYPAFRREASFWAFVLLQAVVYVGPWAVALAGAARGTLQAASVCAAAAGVLTRLVLAARFRHPLWSACLHPLAVLGMLAAAMAAWWRCRFGRGVEWRGRRYRGRRH